MIAVKNWVVDLIMNERMSSFDCIGDCVIVEVISPTNQLLTK